MSLQHRAAPSTARPTGVSKPRLKNPLLQRSHSSPFSAHPRRKPSSPTTIPPPSLRPWKTTAPTHDDPTDRLPDSGIVTTLAPSSKVGDVAQLLAYITSHTFDPIPERGAGMNSVRISEILRYRRQLPPIVSVAHVHALSRSATVADRDIARLVQRGVLRRLRVPDRGVGSAAVGDSLVLVELWKAAIEGCEGIDEESKRRYLDVLSRFPDAPAVGVMEFEPRQASQLIKAGFLTTTSNTALANGFRQPDPTTAGSLTSLISAGARAAAGSMAAVGGEDALHIAGGGGGGGGRRQSCPGCNDIGAKYTLTLPSVGTYLRLLESARAQLLALLARSRYREAPLDLLRERWDGAASSTGTAASRRVKGFSDIVLPGQTKRWKQFHGLRFRWVLEECVGVGAVEVFDTGSVGLGVRLV
ncbi:MAG: hypothetical protein M1828_006575 [Chrysothrix sp. TS-e1954]|nr:MAG: hypothetical protein M1828_006575 [Chrysothrix sp. TS-e1954]